MSRSRPGAREGKATPPLRAFRLGVEYEGTRFAGWQRQGATQTAQGVRTVAGVLERALGEGGLHPKALTGSGRTDAGVHALRQVAHLHLPADAAPRPGELQRLFDQHLPVDVAVARVTPCPLAFHARHDATARTYLYQISQRRTGLAKPFVWWIKGRLDPLRMQEAWRAFEGFHDMRAFADLEDEDPRCEIQSCECIAHGALILLRVTASHFLRRQVRRMVGATVACGLGEARLSDLQHDLEAPGREALLRWSARSAAASGLFLEHVQYPEEPGLGELLPTVRVP